MDWNWIISVLIIIFLILIVWSKMEHKTIKDVIIDIKDAISPEEEIGV